MDDPCKRHWLILWLFLIPSLFMACYPRQQVPLNKTRAFAAQPPSVSVMQASVSAAVATPKPTATPTPRPTVIPTKSAPSRPVVARQAPHPATPAGSHEDWLAAAGIPQSVWSCATTLINRESGWNVYATNKSSGAYGIPQALPGSKMATMGEDWRTNPITQLRWMHAYVNARYNGFCPALQHSYQFNWY